ncbi:MAG: hypothetical protein U0794_15495 [Isosphaeraceae bacterium]
MLAPLASCMLLTVAMPAADAFENQMTLRNGNGVTLHVQWTHGKPFVIDFGGTGFKAVAPDVLARAFRIYALTGNAEVTPETAPLLGSVGFAGGVARFTSRFPIEAGVRYAVRLDGLDGKVPDRSQRPSYAYFSVPPPTSNAPLPPARVVRVAPSAGVLPENLLKFYVEFSAPMSRGEAYEHLSLLDAAGKAIDLPFLELGEELWDSRQTRFTVLFDPGRIKTGLKPRDEAGPVLVAGKTYTLVIDPRWNDAYGRPLAAGFKKTFRVGPADMTPPDPATWTLKPAPAGGRDALVVAFPEPLDRGLLGRLLAVNGPDGRQVAGQTTVADDERSWSFVPSAPWAEGAYQLRVGRELEDLAGNSIGRPFEIDVFEKVDRKVVSEVVSVPFKVLPAGR